MNVIYALILILIAGIANGSFALPTKHIEKWKFENIWLNFALWAFVILPWVIAYFMVPQIFSVYSSAPFNILIIMLLGGFVFGLGQMCFALALNMIGLGLGFVINLGLGIILGFLLPLLIQHPEEIFTPFGIFTLVGSIFAIIGLLYSNKAGNMHHSEQQELRAPEERKTSIYTAGVILAILAGLSSAGQNFAFALTHEMQTAALHAGASAFGAANIIWPGFLLCGFIPYALYMLFLNHKNKSFQNYFTKGTQKYYLFAIVMGLFWYGSLVFYGKATQLIGSLGPIVGWPLFMALIILTSNFWGFRHKEWAGASRHVKSTLWRGLACLILAVAIFGYSSVFHT